MVAAAVTVTDLLVVPPVPLQLSVNVLVLDKGPTNSELAVVLLPDQAPEAVQEVLLVEDQVSVAVPLLPTDVGFAVRVTVGAGADGDGEEVELAEVPPPAPAPPPQATASTAIAGNNNRSARAARRGCIAEARRGEPEP